MKYELSRIKRGNINIKRQKFKSQVPNLTTFLKTLRTSVVDPDPHGSGTFAWIRIQQKVKEHINKTVNSGLFVLLDSSIE